ncbi:MAG: hemin uptake protein HemP [Gammaproteobacteria bacterium]|jgi:hemin uptake protein HemP|nr:hemin uptake protein HemP [Gammaproteobacteria bacterium]
MRDQQHKTAARRRPGDSTVERTIPVRQLLGGAGSVQLEHGGDVYRLRITRNGKLILTK